MPEDIARHRATLSGRIALVTGASRGAGAAIARVLGEAGATVYVTGRSSRGAGTTEGLPGTVEDAAEAVTAAGGRGIACRLDHTDAAAVEGLAGRIAAESGRLDLLVNNAWGGYEHHPGVEAFMRPFWEQPIEGWERMFGAGVRAHWLASRACAPLLTAGATAARPALVVSTVAWAFDAYLQNLLYDAAKAAIIRMSFGLAQELRPRHVASLAVAPGWMRTERVMQAHAESPFDLSPTESPAYLGRAIAALAADPAAMAQTGRLATAGELARRYGFTDEDGRQPEPFRIPAG
ncbi:MAG TPA: SDR family NAD(P)-dependent oxidoreductase [Alphaproteobacteria bacterium]|nr:SDR family NAD(P)-dependent oxidoreductase [Alphaproteobacteria bacterium]